MVMTKSGKPRRTTVGKRRPRVDQTNWRQRLMERRIKFDDDQKRIFLREYAATGLKARSAEKATVSLLTINNHIDNDPDFAEAVDEALQTYRDSVVQEVNRRGKVGVLKPVYNKDGRVYEPVYDERTGQMQRRAVTVEVKDPKTGEIRQEERDELVMVPAFVREFSDRLLELEAKRVEPTYRDKSTIDLNTGGGGVLVAPAGMTPEQWIANAERHNAEADKRHAAEEAELAALAKKTPQ